MAQANEGAKVKQTSLPTSIKPARLAQKLPAGNPDRRGAYSNHTGETQPARER